MLYQWLYNPIIEITALGCHRNIGKMLKIPPTITVSVLLNGLAGWSALDLGRFSGCRGCGMLVMVWAIMLCVVCVSSPLGVVHIYQAGHSCLCYNLYIV